MKTVALEIADAAYIAGGGHVELTFRGLGEHADASLHTTVRRADPAAPCLGPNGWQPGEHLFKAEQVTARENDLVVVVGPSIVDQIDEYTVVEITIPELQVAGRVSWTGVTYTYDSGAAKAATAPVQVRYTVKASGAVQLEAVDSDQTALDLPRQSPAGQAVYGIAFQKIRASHSGVLEVDPLRGTGKQLQQQPWPEMIAFQVHANGAVTLLSEQHGYQENLGSGVNAFGIRHGDLRDARGGNIAIDAATGLGQIIPATPPPLPEEPNRPAAQPAEPAAPSGDESKTNMAPAPEKNPWPIYTGAGLLAVALVAVLLWYFWPTATTSTQEHSRGEPSSPPAADASTPPSPFQAAVKTPAQMHKEAVSAYEAGDVEKARELFGKPMKAGYGPTWHYLAKELDSLDFKKGFYQAPNDMAALANYERACNAGEKSAADSLRRLRQHIKQSGGSGAEMTLSMIDETLKGCQ